MVHKRTWLGARNRRVEYERRMENISAAQQLVLNNQFWDRKFRESINTLNQDALYWLVAQLMGNVDRVDLGDIRQFPEAVVLVDGYRKGVLQRIVVDNNYGWNR